MRALALLMLLAPAFAGAQGCADPRPGPATLRLDFDGDGRVDTASGDRILSFSVAGSEIVASDTSNPGNPVESWRIRPGGDFAELDRQWSTPRIATVVLSGSDGGARHQLAVVFGGGYGEGRGAALFVVRADSGALIWAGRRADLQAGIAAAPALLDSDGDGAVDRLVVGDTGGAIWRADLAGPVAQWKLTRLAQLTERFFYAPDLVQERDASGRYDAVVIGSGDRAHPLATASQESLFLLKDRNTAPGSGVDRDSPPEAWRLPLQAGEKVLSSPVTVAHRIYFTTYVPPADATEGCDAGRAYVRAVRLADGAALAPFALEASSSAPGDAAGRAELRAHGLPAPVVFAATPALPLLPECTVQLSVGSQNFEVPGCTRFRTFWQKVDP